MKVWVVGQHAMQVPDECRELSFIPNDAHCLVRFYLDLLLYNYQTMHQTTYMFCFEKEGKERESIYMFANLLRYCMFITLFC